MPKIRNFVQTLRSQISRKIQKFWRRWYKFCDIITYQILQHFQSDFHTFITFHVSFRLW